MADKQKKNTRVTPDDFERPAPRVAPKKTVVDAVLNGVLAAGNGVVSLLAGLLAGVLIIYSGYVLYDSFSTEYRAYSSAWDLLQYKPEYIDNAEAPLSAGAMENINADYRAWLTVYDTSIDYPVLQGADDLYYAWHDIYKQSSLTGAIYLAAQNSPDFTDSYNLIYGHHMDNGAMFGRLDSFRDADYYDVHREGVVVTKSGVYDFRVFAVADTDAYETRVYTVGDRMRDVLDFLASGGEGGVGVGTDVLRYDAAEAALAEKVLALSTCASAETSGRLVVFGRLMKRNLISVTAEGYSGVYDGQSHGLTASASVSDAVLEYSVDGGATWTRQPPVITDVGEIAVKVRATSPVNGVAETEVTLKVAPRPVIVTVASASKTAGTPDPAFGASAQGLLDGDSVRYALSREPGEKPGQYAITAAGEALQGNYMVTYVPGTLTITAAPTARPTARPVTPTARPTAAPAPKPDEPAGTVSLTIRKVWQDDGPETRPAGVRMVLHGDTLTRLVALNAANGWTATIDGLPAGERYSWIEPEVSGYRCVSTTSAGGVTTVTNALIRTDAPSPERTRSYTLTVRYRYIDGSEAAATYRTALAQGESYEVFSPTIPGYTAVPVRIAGTMPGRDVTYTVLFVPDGGEELSLIDNYGTPLGVAGAHIVLGDCFE